MFLAQLLTIAVIHLLAVMSPGPDFILVSRNSLIYSRKTARLTAVGLGLGILVHVAYSLIGIGFLISQSIVLFSIIKFIGAGYLIYIGYKSLTSKKSKLEFLGITKQEDVSAFQAIKMGFITNVTNPKVTLFFLSLFTQVIDPSTPLLWQITYGLEMSLVTFLWFALVATAFTHPVIKKKVAKIQHSAEKIMGGLLVLLGVKLALSKAN